MEGLDHFMSTLSSSELELFYDDLALAIDEAGTSYEAVFLGKLVLTMAHEWGNYSRLKEMLSECVSESAENSSADSRLL